MPWSWTLLAIVAALLVLVSIWVRVYFALGDKLHIRQRLAHRFNRVLRWGRDTYIRFYPNPGIGICFKSHRVALSLVGGLEIFERHPRIVWRRTYSKWSRVKRPGALR